MRSLESDIAAIENGCYKDAFVKVLVAEEGQRRRRLIRSVKEEFDDYFERMDADYGQMIYHRGRGVASVRHSIVSGHRFRGRPEFSSMWSESLHIETDPDTMGGIVHIHEDSLSVSAHGLAFRVRNRTTRLHPSGLKVVAESETPGSVQKRASNISPERQLRDIAGAPDYLEVATVQEIGGLFQVNDQIYRPLGILMSLGSGTVVESIVPTQEGRVGALYLP